MSRWIETKNGLRGQGKAVRPLGGIAGRAPVLAGCVMALAFGQMALAQTAPASSGGSVAAQGAVVAPAKAGGGAGSDSGGTSITLPKIAVEGVALNLTPDQQLQLEGSSESGYRPVTATTTGAWGAQSIQNTPYSISVIPSQLIQNVQAEDAGQLYKMDPLTQAAWNISQYDNNSNAVTLRGFPTGANILYDGVNMPNAADNSLEDKQRVEILTGETGFLYGAANEVGGVVNWVLKRPTATPYHEITIGDYGGGQFYDHIDMGGPLTSDGRVGYRLNIVNADGSTAYRNQSLNRYLYSGAIDWHVTNNLLIQANASNQYYEIHGLSGTWATLTPGAIRPDPPPADQIFSQPWSFIRTFSTNYGLKATWDIDDAQTIRAEWQHQIDDRTAIYNINDNLTNSGTYLQFHDGLAPTETIDDGAYLYLDSRFNTAWIKHVLTLGFSYSNYRLRQYDNTQPGFGESNLSFSDPFVPRPPGFSTEGVGPMYTASQIVYKNFLIGDNIQLGEQWSLLFGVNYADISQGAFNTSSVETSNYAKSAVTPSASLLFKPRPWLTTYVTYMQGLQPGTIVSALYANAGQALPPLIDTQYEIGAKATLGGLLLTGALFRIEEANEYSNNAVPIPSFVQDGRQVNKGIELTATGKLTDRLSVFGGMTLLDPTVVQSNTPADNGKRPVNVADVFYKMYLEYSVPKVPGLVLTSGVYYTGQQYGDTLNTDKIPGYVVTDVGARYVLNLKTKALVFRFDADNVTGADYWQNSATVGAPRTFEFSTSLEF